MVDVIMTGKKAKLGVFLKIKGWVGLSRPPFHMVGLLPFLLGTILAWRLNGVFNLVVFSLGVLAIILIMLSTYHAGEYFDNQEDEKSQWRFKSRFAGGSGVTQAGILSRTVPLCTSIITLLMAGIVGLVLQLYFKTGPYTVLLGCLGALPGFFYSTPPFRLVEKGFGELFIGFCYGWLPVAAAFYIQVGYIESSISWISIPIGLTIFNVILLNEFPDYLADFAVGKKNMLVRLGKKRGTLIYVVLSILAWIAMFFTIVSGISAKALYLYIPIMIISAFVVVMMLKEKYEDNKTLEILCGLNIFINLGTTASYLLALV
jgi:1,4-dihydroxy-2-naphthoate octaprenyltransferase